MSFTNYLEEKILEHVFTGTPYTKPAQWYVTCFTTTPADDGTGGVEMSGGSWGGRKAVNFGEYVSGGVPSTLEVTFIMAAGTVNAVALMDAAAGGNICSIKAITPGRTYADGEPVIIAVGDLIQTLD